MNTHKFHPIFVLKKLRLILFTCLLVIGLSATLNAAVEIIDSVPPKEFIPRGQEAFMLCITLSDNLDENTTITKIKIRNDAAVRFGDGIKTINIYEDTGGCISKPIAGIKNNLRGTKSFIINGQESPGNLDETIDLSTIALNEEKRSTGLYIAYEISETATLKATANIRILDINNRGALLSNSLQITSEIKVSGFNTPQNITSIAPSEVIPGDEHVGMLALQLESAGEDLGKINFKLTINNPANNFVTSNLTNKNSAGITKIYLFDDPNGDLAANWNPDFFDPSGVILTITGDEFKSSSEAVFDLTNAPGDFVLQQDSSSNFIVLYDIGEKFTVDNDTVIQAQLTRVEGTGGNSGLPLIDTLRYPLNDIASAKVAGITHSNLIRAVPVLADQDLFFGTEQIVPILQFSLKSFHVTANINTISIGNAGSVQFQTSATDPSNIQRIDIYQDTDNDSTFSGTNNPSDRLVGSITKGSGNSPTLAEITLNNVQLQAFDDTQSSYPNDNTEIFFVVYHFGTQITEFDIRDSKSSIAALNDARFSITINGDSRSIQLSGTKPANANPLAEIIVSETTVHVQRVENINPTNVVIKGQEKFPVLAVELFSNARANINNSSMTITNRFNTFNDGENGVKKVYIYKDTFPTSNLLDDTSTFITSNANIINGSRIELKGIPIIKTETNRYLILYDIGAQTTEGLQFSAQLQNVQNVNRDNEIVFGGVLPTPKTPVNISVIKGGTLVIKTITTSSSDLRSNLSTFNVSISVTNTTSEPLNLVDIEPRFYLDIIGKDISTEFSITRTFFLPTSLPANSSITFPFQAKHDTRFSEGSIRVDGFVKYEILNVATPIIVKREDEGKTAATVPAELIIDDTTSKFSWTYPSYVKNIENKLTPGFTFGNGNAVTKGSEFLINFKNFAKNISEASIHVYRNSVELNKTITSQGFSANQINNGFSFNEETGILSVNAGNVSGTILVTLNDNEGNPLDPLSISYIINEQLEISEAYFYPNPFIIGSQNLKLGFNLTQSADVDVYIFSFLGVQVAKETFNNLSTGYNTVEFGALSSFFSSGHFLCKIIATNSTTGQKASAKAKLAIY